MASNNPNKRAFPNKPTDPRLAANKRQKTPAPKMKKPEASAGPATAGPAPSTSIRTDQELKAEARQNQLDLGFILVLSEDPQKWPKRILKKKQRLTQLKLKRL